MFTLLAIIAEQLGPKMRRWMQWHTSNNMAFVYRPEKQIIISDNLETYVQEP